MGTDKDKAPTGEIFKAIPQIMADVGAIGKDSKNTQQGYKYRGIDAVYNALNEVMAKHKVFTTCIAIENETVGERVSKSGSALFEYKATFVYRFYAADGSFVDFKAIGKGMDSGDKDTNKAMSVAHKYALLQTFAIPTDDPKDPEVDDHEVKPVDKKPKVDQEKTNLSIKMFEAYKIKIAAIENLEALEETRANFEEYVKGPKNPYTPTQIEILRKALAERHAKLQELAIGADEPTSEEDVTLTKEEMDAIN